MRKRTFFSKNIAVFVAGSIKLKSERDALKAMVLDLNSKSRIQRLGTHVDIKSYEDDFKNKQEEYNKFVQKTADLVFVLITDSIGDNTESELKTASESLCENGWPEVYVFIKDDNTLKDDDPRVMKMREYLGQDSYAIRFKDSDELKIEARKRIMHHVGLLYLFSRNVKKWILRFLLFSLLFLVGFLGWKLYTKKQPVVSPVISNVDSIRPLVLFAGGGSVANYIKQEYSLDTNDPVDVSNYPNAIYANMPSGNARILLSEDYNRYMNEKLTFRTICLSASRASENEFHQSCDSIEFFNKVSIVECYIGEDPLVVYVKKEGSERYLRKKWIDEKRITPEGLASLIKQPDAFNVFSTAANSGTSNFYQEILPSKDSINFEKLIEGKKAFVYNEASDIKVFKCDESTNNLPYIVLGSKYYYSLALQSKGDDNYYQLQVYNNISGKPFSKSIYLYFLAFKKNDRNNVIIPQSICNFLRKTKIVNTSKWKKWVHNDTLLKSRDNVIYLTERPDEL